tara:strand:+ start:2044 stop:2283 length:240 start_codon:yes stop_codon:yes gene_type:complete
LDLTSYFGVKNYCHILLDQIPRMRLLEEEMRRGGYSNDLNSKLKILVDNAAPDFFIKIIDSYFDDFEVVKLKERVRYRF